jgi:hypothetical protein
MLRLLKLFKETDNTALHLPQQLCFQFVVIIYTDIQLTIYMVDMNCNTNLWTYIKDWKNSDH